MFCVMWNTVWTIIIAFVYILVSTDANDLSVYKH